MSQTEVRFFEQPARQRLLRAVLLISTSVLAYFALVVPISSRPSNFLIRPGEVASQEFQAPRTVEYISEVRTAAARDAAESAVEPVFAPADPAIARSQIEKLRVTLQYISLVRNDNFSTVIQKKADLAALTEIQLKQDTADKLLALNPARWDAIQQEALSVVERVMRNNIRQEQLQSYQHSLPSLVSLSLSEDQAQLVIELAAPFVAANSFYSDDLTESARQAARAQIEPVTHRYVAGETIVQRGQVITTLELEALNELGLVQSESPVSEYLAAAAVVLVTTTLVAFYFIRRKPPLLQDLLNLIIIAIIFLVFFLGARLSIPNRTVIPYLFPIPAFALLLSTLFGIEAGLLLSVVTCVLAAYGLPNSLDLTLYYLFASFFGVLVLGQARRVSDFLRSGLAVAAAGSAVIVAYRWSGGGLDWLGLVTLVGAAVFNGVASTSLTLLLQFSLANILGLTTPLQLLEIARPDFPLMQFFLRNAPGTYQHSLQVANLAEQAAEAIGADALLTRVGALYHDCGKSLNPLFFIENQVPGNLNPHDDLDPELSAATIIQHVPDGLQLARKYRLPRRIRDFISEHHGTMVTRYQYNQAVEVYEPEGIIVDIESFRYPGPIPHSKETAILMLADGVEARARAERPDGEEELFALVMSVVERCQKEGQFDQAPLTLRDVHRVAESFVKTLRGTYHPRIQYPQIEVQAANRLTSANAPTVPVSSEEK